MFIWLSRSRRSFIKGHPRSCCNAKIISPSPRGPLNSSSFLQRMHPVANCHHSSSSSSSSGLLGNLEGKMTKNFNKMGKQLRDKLSMKKDGGIFVPSQSPSSSTSDPSQQLPRSISQVEPLYQQHLSPNMIDQRRQSSPAPLYRAPAMMPQQPPPVGWAPLSIETFGGECAGSGFNYLNEDAQYEEEDIMRRKHIDAQNLSLSWVQREIRDKEEMLRKTKEDNQTLNDFLAITFAAKLGTQDIEVTKEKIEQLKDALINYSKWPGVKPYTPPRPANNANSWACPRCAEQNPCYETHCRRCKFPKLEIDVKECIYCNCPECVKTAETKLLVSVAPEDGWQMVNFINPPARKQS